MKKRFFALTLLAASSICTADVYKCVGPDGLVTFSNNPFCEQKQAYAKDRNEPLLTVKPEALTKLPPDKIFEVYEDKTYDLPGLLEEIGRFTGIQFEPVGLEGNEVVIHKGSHLWLEMFNTLVADHQLDYRQAYGRIYIYKIGTMGETIIHSPELLRWYQSDTTWNVVMKNDDILLAMNPYKNTELKERLHKLVNMVREELKEPVAVNAAESIEVKTGYTAGVGSGIANRDEVEENRRAAAEKARRIISRRQAN